MYDFNLPTALLDNWSEFENKGYLPEMPGELVETDLDWTGATVVYSLQVPEHEAWEFKEAVEELGDAFGAIMSDDLKATIYGWLDQVV